MSAEWPDTRHFYWVILRKSGIIMRMQLTGNQVQGETETSVNASCSSLKSRGLTFWELNPEHGILISHTKYNYR